MIFALFAFAVLGASFGSPVSVTEDPVELAEEWIRCINVVLEDGLEEVGIPPHNPLYLSHNLTHTIDIPLIGEAEIGLVNTELDGIVKYNFTQLDGALVTNASGIESLVYNYSIYWPDITFAGTWELNIGGLIPQHSTGHFSIHLEHTTFTGIWDMVPSGEGVERELNNVTVGLAVGKVHSEISNIPIESISEATISEAVYLAVNAIKTETTSNFLKGRLELGWIHNQERIDAIIDHCKNSGKF